jgi:hypothetical protein
MKPGMNCPSIGLTTATSFQPMEQKLEAYKYSTQEVVEKYHVKTKIIQYFPRLI